MADDSRRKMTPAASGGRLTEFTRGSNEAMKLAMYHANLILGSYRADQANDPEVYVTAISHLLSRYPPDIGARLTDPKDGVAGKYKWLPSVSEVREEAERFMEADRMAVLRQQNLREQFALRDRVEAEEKAESPEQRQQTAQRILRETKEAFAKRRDEPYNVFVPTFAPQYREMVTRGGLPGVSLEDKNRTGVWVPHSWLQGHVKREQTWQQYTADELLARYSRPQSEPT